MIDNIELHYRRIADSIREAVPEEWSSARMEAVFYSESTAFFGEYVRRSDGKLKDLAATSDNERAFQELRTAFKQQGQPVWGQASFELSADGKFNLHVSYDNCDENGNAIFDESS